MKSPRRQGTVLVAALLVVVTSVAAATTAMSVVNGLHRQNRAFAAHLEKRPCVMKVTVGRGERH